jgi:NADH-quinone oxidoreductase subunit N
MGLSQWKELLFRSGLGPEFALLGCLLLLSAWVWLSPKSGFGFGIWISLLGLTSYFFLAGLGPGEGSFQGLLFYPWTTFVKRSLCVSTFVALFSWLEWRNGRQQATRAEGLVFLIGSLLSLSILIQAKSLWLLLLAAEGFSFCSYGLARPVKEAKEGAQSLLQYFTTGSLASAVGIFGMTWILGFQDHPAEASNDFFASASFFPVVGAVFYSAALLFKLGALPFHFWVPGLYEQAPTPLVGYIAAAPKLAGGLAILNMVGIVEANLTLPLLTIALAGMWYGNLGAYSSSTIRHMLAFSAIGQAGFLLLPAVFSRQIAGADSILVIFGFAYLLAIQSAFSCIQYFENHLKEQLKISDLSGQFSRHPLPSLLFLLIILSLVGLPPLLGFSGKLLLFSSLLGGSNLLPDVILYLTFGSAVLVTLISMGYFFRIPYQLFFQPALMEEHSFRNSSASLLWMLLASLTLVLAFFKPDLLFSFV